MADNPTKQSGTHPQIYTRTLGRAQREEKLKHLFASGADTIPHQIRYVLALSQMTNAPSITTTPNQNSHTVTKARLTALTNLTRVLDGKQVKTLLKEVSQIKDESVRIPLVIHLALQLEADDYRNIINDTWKQVHKLDDPVTRARTLLQLAPVIALMDDEPGTPRNLLDVVAFAQSLSNTEARVRSLVALAPHLPATMSTRLLKRSLDDLSKSLNDSLRANTIVAMVNFLPTELEVQAFESALAIKSPIERARALTALAKTVKEDKQNALKNATLDTIAQIENEEERANAFNSFVPYIGHAKEDEEFPVLIEKALRIAIAMLRRHIRARALVSLAPNLTPDLQGEALAAVHSLESERERATLLADLAPTLPPDMLVASLAVAHTMREQDARVHALSVLAHHVPEHARDQTVLDALAAAVNLPHQFERVTALMSLIDILPPIHKTQAFTNALEAIRLIDNQNAKARALSIVGAQLPSELINRAFDLAIQIETPQQQLNALTGIVSRLSDDTKTSALQHMLNCANQMPFAYKQTRALVSIAPHLTADLFDEALTMANELEEPFDRASAYIALAQNMSPERRPDVIKRAWELIGQIEDGYDRASALSAIAPFMPENQKNALANMANEVIGGIMDEYDQASAISILASLLIGDESPETNPQDQPSFVEAVKEAVLSALHIREQSWRVELFRQSVDLWTELPQDKGYELWTAVAWRMTTIPLADTLLCLGAVTPIIRTLCGDEKLKEIAQILGMR